MSSNKIPDRQNKLQPSNRPFNHGLTLCCFSGNRGSSRKQGEEGMVLPSSGIGPPCEVTQCADKWSKHLPQILTRSLRMRRSRFQDGLKNPKRIKVTSRATSPASAPKKGRSKRGSADHKIQHLRDFGPCISPQQPSPDGSCQFALPSLWFVTSDRPWHETAFAYPPFFRHTCRNRIRLQREFCRDLESQHG